MNSLAERDSSQRKGDCANVTSDPKAVFGLSVGSEFENALFQSYFGMVLSWIRRLLSLKGRESIDREQLAIDVVNELICRLRNHAGSGDYGKFPSAIVVTEFATSFADMDEFCTASLRNRGIIPNVGQWWGDSMSECGYDHTRRPNDRRVDCLAHLGGFSVNSKTLMSIAARSRHSGGIYAGLLDGSVRWTNSNIDLQIWRALGTHHGGEIVAE